MVRLRHMTIATRQSPLALWQARWVKKKLEEHYGEIQVTLLPIVTTGDIRLEQSLASIGGKGLFIKELEQTLLEGRAHIAVHSMKDMPFDLPKPFVLGAILEREDPRDALVSQRAVSIETLPLNGVIGTCSLRRQSQLLALRPDLSVKPLRGNVGTRLCKLEEGHYDGIILAAAGLHRLDQSHRITEFLPQTTMVSAVGQGAIGIECLAEDSDVLQCISVLNHQPTVYCITAERAMNKLLNGNCHTPIGGYGILKDSELQLTGFVGRVDGSKTLYETRCGTVEHAEALGFAVGQALLDGGAGDIIHHGCS